ncbi:hypothetical protein H4S02_004758 [Coemansia sp. RSA 2611]|nr:hypothetical protein H4S02_004758 [Coemansia sp. RSA 2611]KAJ2408102.1 hypothetical protein GGI10_004895 [Coemansia sp. RSA 2530]
MLSRVLVPLSRVAVGRFALGVRGFGASALVSKTAVKAAAIGGKKPAATKAKTVVKAKSAAAKPKRAAAKPKKRAAAKPKKRVVAKPKRVAAKKPTKSDLHEKVINSTRPIVKLPKQAPSAYSLFIRDRWKSVEPREEGTEQAVAFAAVARETSSAWKALSDAGKHQYMKQSDALRSQQAQAVRQWWAGVDRGQVALENQRRRRYNRRVAQKLVKGPRMPLLRDPLAPKRPSSAFFLFMKERLVGTTGPISETAKAASAEWKSLAEAAKAPYVAKAVAASAAYKTAVAKYASSS